MRAFEVWGAPFYDDTIGRYPSKTVKIAIHDTPFAIPSLLTTTTTANAASNNGSSTTVTESSSGTKVETGKSQTAEIVIPKGKGKVTDISITIPQPTTTVTSSKGKKNDVAIA